MRLPDKYKETYQQYPQLPVMKKLWHAGYYDGAYSGLCLVDGQKCWFDTIEEWHGEWPEDDEDFDPPYFRRFLIWKLSDEALAVQEERHLKFQRMVGTHADYDEYGKRSNSGNALGTATAETLKQYYDEAKDPNRVIVKIDMDPTDDNIVGWYEWK